MNLHRSRIAGITLGIAVALVASSASAQGTVAPARAELSALDQPIAWMTDAKRNYSAVKDYTCVLVSQERVRGKLEVENVIEFKMRPEPFSVAMRWLTPKKTQGQQVIYVQGKNNNRMRVKSTFFGANVVGFVSVDINDPRVMQHSRHTIVEAGIGNMIDTALRHWEIERRLAKTDVKIAEYKFDNRPCYRIELTRAEKRSDVHSHRTIMFLEKESKIPIHVENYEHPREGGPPGGDLLEIYSYTSLRFNVGLKDAEFDK